MTPADLRRQLRMVRKQVEKISRVDTRYRQHAIAAIARLNRLESAISPLCPKPGPKPKGAA